MVRKRVSGGSVDDAAQSAYVDLLVYNRRLLTRALLGRTSGKFTNAVKQSVTRFNRRERLWGRYVAPLDGPEPPVYETYAEALILAAEKEGTEDCKRVAELLRHPEKYYSWAAAYEARYGGTSARNPTRASIARYLCITPYRLRITASLLRRRIQQMNGG